MPAGNPTAATLIRKQDPKGSARVATTVALPANTRVDNVLTVDANGALPAIDGVTLAVADPVERVLVKNEATGENNGIYDVTDVGSAGSKWVLTRSADFDADEKVTSGAATFVSEGTVNAAREYTLITADPITINTTALVFTQTGGTTPAAHDLGGAGHNADTLANLNTKVSDANLDDSSASRTPTAHALGGAEHLASTLVELNVKVSDANLDDSGATRTPTAHALGGAEHTADTLVNLNAKINDANLDDSTASRTPSGSASGDLEGTYPGPTVKQSSVTQHEAAIDHDALANFDITEHRIINDGGVSTTELFSAQKIDSLIGAVTAGVDIKEAVATTTKGVGNITLSGEQTLNGLLTSASRVLVTDQTIPSENGIYVSDAAAWSRATDANEDAEVTNGNVTHVTGSASTKFKFKYLLVTADPITVGTTGQTWEEHKDIDFGTTTGTATEGNDTRVPTQDENDALVGTSGAPSTANKYVTNADARNTNARAPTAHASDHTDGTDDIQDATSGQKGLATLIQIGKLDAIASGAEVNPAVVSQADAEAGVATDERIWTAERVKQAIAALAAGAPAIFSAESNDDSSTTGTGFVQKLKLTFTAEAANYIITYSAEIRSSDSGTKVLARMQEDDTTTHAESEVIPDSDELTGYGSFSGFKLVTLTAASHDFDIDFASSQAGQTVNIRRARLVAMKVQ